MEEKKKFAGNGNMSVNYKYLTTVLMYRYLVTFH